ncbi:MAG: hypothetical protein AAFP84_05250 [Actinomycetota bacterium]
MAGTERSASGAIAPGEYESVTLHSSWLGIGFAGAGAFILVAIAVLVLASNGVGVVSVVIAAIAAATAGAVLFDMPIATTFDAEGALRRTPIRRHRIRWESITRLARNRSVLLRRRTGGLVASLSPVRQVMLVDRMEGNQEHHALRQVIPLEDRPLLEGVDEPPLDRRPTWLDRRKKWRPPSAP